jgi:putative spermidine/putrescine transport system ATP-binding protein
LVAGAAALSGSGDCVAFNGEKQRLVVGGAAGKPLTVDAPNTLQIKPGDRVGLSISPEAVRLLPPED